MKKQQHGVKNIPEPDKSIPVGIASNNPAANKTVTLIDTVCRIRFASGLISTYLCDGVLKVDD